MAGRERDRRGSLAMAPSSGSSSSSGSGWRAAPEQHERWPRSPAWSRPLSESDTADGGRGGRRSSSADALRSLFRSIGLWFSSLSTAPPSASMKRRSREDEGDAKKPPLPGGTKPPSARGLYGGSIGRGQPHHQQPSFQSCCVFSIEEILAATSNFSPALKIGQGGFGAVYRGVLPDGTVVAVKRAKLRMQMYLHMYSDHPIIHRDIKSSNILLTHSLRAKVADFGFARLGAGGLEGSGGGADTNKTHVTTQVKGTAGYLDPEYLKTCQLTDRSDVYSFGVLLVELASARRPIETRREMRERLTARWAMARLIAGAPADVLDPHLPRTPAAERAVEALLELAFRCMGPVRKDRPAMSDCCRALWAIRKTYRDDMLQAADQATTPQQTSLSDSSTSGDLWRDDRHRS